MAARLTSTDIRRFLAALGERVGAPTDLYLLGGGALCLLGSARFTQDLDYVGLSEAAKPDDLAQVIDTLAAEMGIDVEIALSKLDRGHEADLQDVEFHARAGLVDLDRLADMVRDARQLATAFDLDGPGMVARLSAIRARVPPPSQA